jgi:hypothetical protein
MALLELSDKCRERVTAYVQIGIKLARVQWVELYLSAF